MSRENRFLWSAIAAMSLAIIVASWVTGPPDRKLPPRDYLPVVLAGLAVAIAQVRDRKR